MAYTTSSPETIAISSNDKFTPEPFPVTNTVVESVPPVEINPDKVVAKPFKKDGSTAVVAPVAEVVRCAQSPRRGAEEFALLELACRIRESRQAAQKAGVTALHHILDAGDALNAAQDRVSTGWKRWLQDNCFLSVRTALLYQQLANHREEIEDAISQAGELSLRTARRLIAVPKKTQETERQEENEPGALENPAPKGSNLRKGNGQAEAPLDPVAVWKAFSLTDKARILDSEGRTGLAELVSPTLLVELGDHALALQIDTASCPNVDSKKFDLRVTLTKILRQAVSTTSKIESSNSLAALKHKLEANNRNFLDLLITFPKKRAPKKR